MTLKRGLKGLSFLLIAIGAFIIIIQPMSTTGAVIDLSTAVSRVWFFIGLGLIAVGAILLVIKESILEKIISQVNVIPKSYEKSVNRHVEKKEDLEKIPYSIQEAVKQGIHPGEARKIWKKANENVSSGYWVELDAFRIEPAKYQEGYPQSTQIMRYWGPKEYESLSRRKLDDAYKRGEIGKTHELVVGSDIYPQTDLKTKKLKSGKTSLPPKASRVLHRHWEVAQMHNYQKNPRKK